MPFARLEHVNLTVSDPDAVAGLLVQLLGWRVRWSGPSMNGGRSVHVGGDHDYVALYSPRGATDAAVDSYGTRLGLNHLGVVVDDLDAAGSRARELGLEPYEFGDYEPGRRFYVRTPEGLELELVQYG